MASDMWLSQVAIIVSLVGMSLGWLRVMTRYSGFYDLTTAWSMMFWGILIGGVYGSLGDSFLLSIYIQKGSPSFCQSNHMLNARCNCTLGFEKKTSEKNGFSANYRMGIRLSGWRHGFPIPYLQAVSTICHRSTTHWCSHFSCNNLTPGSCINFL